MLLLLIRHAQAAQQDEALYPDDSLRPLVPKGRRIQRRISRRLRKRKLVPTRVFNSPWKRAWQTARIVVEETGLPKNARIACAALAAPPDLQILAAEIGEIGPEETIALEECRKNDVVWNAHRPCGASIGAWGRPKAKRFEQSGGA